jgi:hypothetical protein
VNFFSLVVAAWQAWQARDIQDEFSEGKYIGLSIFSLCQAFMTGVPILAVVKDIPEAFYLMTVFLIFMLCVVVLSLVFLPKIIMQYKYSRMTPSQQRQMLAVSVRKSALSQKDSSNRYGSDDLSARQISGLEMPQNSCGYYGSGSNGSKIPTDHSLAGFTMPTSSKECMPSETIEQCGQSSTDDTLSQEKTSLQLSSDTINPSNESKLVRESQENVEDVDLGDMSESDGKKAETPIVAN